MDSFLTRKNPIEMVLEEEARARKSPAVEGTIAASKAALIATPFGAAFQAIRDKNIGKGALIAGLGAAALAGLTGAAVQKYRNLQSESHLRYHLRNLVEREPMVAMPSPEAMSDAAQAGSFGQGFEHVHRTY